MAAVFKYTLPVEETHWIFEGASETAFTWNYDTQSEELLRLYSKGKQQQWDAEERIDQGFLTAQNAQPTQDRLQCPFRRYPTGCRRPR